MKNAVCLLWMIIFLVGCKASTFEIQEPVFVEPSQPYPLSPEELPVLGLYKFARVAAFGNAQCASIFVADLDNDGDDDLLLSSEENNSINQVYENTGGGVFRNTGDVLEFNDTGNPRLNFGLAVGDLNGDGLKDIAAADAWAGMNIYLNRGDLRFAWSQAYSFRGLLELKGVGIADLNNDGFTDVVVGSHNGDNRGDRVLLNDGEGNLVDTRQSLNADVTWDIAMVDVNQDRAPDFISINRYAESAQKLNLNNGEGRFMPPVLLPDSVDDSADIKCFTQGKYSYCFVANSWGFSKEGEYLGRDRYNREFVFNEKGELIQDIRFGEPNAETKEFCLIDFNHDGNMDLVSGNWNGPVVMNLSKPSDNGSLTFGPDIPLFQIGNVSAIGCADFNGDGLFDFVVGDQRNSEPSQYVLVFGIGE